MKKRNKAMRKSDEKARLKRPSIFGDNVIRIYEPSGSGVPGHLAAYFMGVIASIDNVQKPSRRVLRTRSTSRKNPLRLPRKLHVLPRKSICRFTNKQGVVQVHDNFQNLDRPAKPDDLVFCARGAWHKRAEIGYMKRIENAFQQLAEEIIAGDVLEISATPKIVFDDFYALWYMRARYKYLDSEEVQARGVGGAKLTLQQEDNLENEGFLFSRDSGRIPARQVNGLQLQFRIRGYADQIHPVTQWGIIHAQEGQFIVPDVPTYSTIPLTPTLCLISPAQSGVIDRDNVAQINRETIARSEEYFFANDFTLCPR
jgi:hypothetical protein